MQDNIAQPIYLKVLLMPDALALEILDFIDFVALKHQDQFQDAQLVQMSSLGKIWENTEDNVWNNAKIY